MRTLWSRFHSLFRRGRLDREMDEEFRAHLAMLEDELRAKGMSAAEARSEARRQFGGVAAISAASRGWSRSSAMFATRYAGCARAPDSPPRP